MCNTGEKFFTGLVDVNLSVRCEIYFTLEGKTFVKCAMLIYWRWRGKKLV